MPETITQEANVGSQKAKVSDMAKGSRMFIVLVSLLASMLLFLADEVFDLSEEFDIMVYGVTIFMTAFIVLVVRDWKDPVFWLLSGILLLVLLASSAYTASECNPSMYRCYSESVFKYFLLMGIAVTVILFFAQTYLDTRDRSFPYSKLFNYSWENYITIKLTAIFVGVFWGLLVLWAELFNTLEISIFDDLFFRTDWFQYILNGLLIGLGVVVFRNQKYATNVIKRILHALMRWLLPLLALINILFLVAFAVKGTSTYRLDDLNVILIWLVVLTLFFSNAVYQDGKQQAYGRYLDLFIRFALVIQPFYLLIVFYNLFSDVARLGWQIDLLWLFIVLVVFFSFSVLYAIKVIKFKQDWMPWMIKVNKIMAVSIACISILLLTPVLNLNRIAANDLYDRIISDEVKFYALAGYDFAELGVPGIELLEKLKKHDKFINDKNVQLTIDTYISDPYSYGNTVTVVKHDEIAELFDLYPAGETLPDGIVTFIEKNQDDFSQCFSADSECVVIMTNINDDSNSEYVFLGGYTNLYSVKVLSDKSGAWDYVAHASHIENNTYQTNIRDNLEVGDIQTREENWKVLGVGDVEFHFKSN